MKLGKQEILKPAELSVFLDVSQALVSKWRYTGGGPPFTKDRWGRISYRRSDVIKFVKANNKTPGKFVLMLRD